MTTSVPTQRLQTATVASTVTADSIERCCRILIDEIGEDHTREGLQDTPKRFAKAIRELTAGYSQDIESVLNGALFKAESTDLIIVKDIEFYSLCEHHVLPFFGKAHIAYIPDKTIIGLSKIPRIVQLYSQRLQVQERLTSQIALQLDSILQPKGLLCVLEATHLCMAMRGVKSSESVMRTQKSTGVFTSDLVAATQVVQQLNLGAACKQ